MPCKKASGLVPRKKGLDTERYGGYNKSGIMFLTPMRYKIGKKSDIIILSIELLYGKLFLKDEVFAKKYAEERLQKIIGKKADEVSFPMGMKPWKINTVLSLDGFNVCITGIGGGGKCLSAQPIMQLSLPYELAKYLKKIEKFVEKNKNNANYIYDEQYDSVSVDENIKLYDVYLDKLENSIYNKRINSPEAILKNGREKFCKLNVLEQAVTLINIQSIFGRMTGGCDLENIGGKKHSAATVNFSSNVSNWKKYYNDVRVVYQSPSGIWERRSQNIFELL